MQPGVVQLNPYLCTLTYIRSIYAQRLNLGGFQEDIKKTSGIVKSNNFCEYTSLPGQLKAIFHWEEFSGRSDFFFYLETNWQRVGVKRQNEIPFCAKLPPGGKQPFA